MLVALVLAAQLHEPLAERHLRFVNEEVHFLLGSEERSRFSALGTATERDLFIERFWRRRDPTPETLANEARDAHAARLAASDRLFTDGGTPGRFSERGRLYQLLGPPGFRETFAHAGHRLVPLELWHYTGVAFGFLPPSFHLVFFRPDGQGPFRLWNPVADGARALVRGTEPGRSYLESELETIARLDRELAAVVEEGLVPGATSGSIVLLAQLEVLADLAARELSRRGSARAEAGFDELRARLEAAVLFDDAGVAEIHYALAVAAGQRDLLSWERRGGKLRTRFAVAGRLTRGARELERWEDEIALELSEEEFRALEGAELSFQGRRLVPLEATRVEVALASPSLAHAVRTRELEGSGLAVVPRAGVVVAAPRERLPFWLQGRILEPGSVPAGSAALALVQGRFGDVVSFELSGGDTPVWTDSGRIPDERLLERRLPTEGLVPGSYTLKVTRGSSTDETAFRIEAGARATTRILARGATPEEEARYRRARSRAFRRAGHRERAIEEMARAVENVPASLDDQLELAALRFAEGRCPDLLRQLRPVAEDLAEPDVYVFLGACSEDSGETRQALEDYERALALAPGNDDIASAVDRLSEALAEMRRRNN